MIRSSLVSCFLRVRAPRLLGLAGVIAALAALSVAPAGASDRVLVPSLSAGLGQYVTPATSVTAGTGVRGTASVERKGGTAEVELAVTGLQPGSQHAAHVHLGSCLDLLGHFRYDPNGPGTRANEVWLDLTADAEGAASDRVRVRAFDLNRPLSIVVHQGANPPVGTPGSRIACGNLVPPARRELRVGPYTTPATGVVVNSGVSGLALATTEDGGTTVRLWAFGLQPGSRHAAHIHVGSCASLLGHFRYDPNGPATRDNEIWLDLKADSRGRATAGVRVRAIDLTMPLSLVIHQGANPPAGTPGARIACGPVALHAV